MEDYLELRTTENTRVFIRRTHVSAVEEILASARAEGFLKLYVSGYAFHIKKELPELMKLLATEPAKK